MLIEELERLEKAASAAPWPKDFARSDTLDCATMAVGPLIYPDDPDVDADVQAQCDQDFLAAMRNALPGMLEEIKAGRKMLLWRDTGHEYDGYPENCSLCSAETEYRAIVEKNREVKP